MLHRQCLLRSNELINPQLDSYGMSGLFGKLVNALAKPFTKIFKPHTLLGKIADPLGLASRNLKWTYKAADIVGTAASLAVGAWAVGAAAGGAGAAGGFWSTAATGAKLAGGAALKAVAGVGKGIGAAAKFLAPAAATMFAGGNAPAAAVPGMQFPTETMVGQVGQWSDAALTGGGGGEPTVTVTGGGVGLPPGEATVEVNDTMPEEGPPWLLIGGAALAFFLILQSRKKRGVK